MGDMSFRSRIDALEDVWSRWAEIDAGLSEQQWSRATRCTGWDVAAQYAHVGMFPPALVTPPDLATDDAAPTVTAVDILRGFNADGGVAHDMAEQVAHSAVSTAAELGQSGLVALYAETGPKAIAALRAREGTAIIPWPGAGALTTWTEGIRIVLMESVVHLLDVFDGLGRDPEIPEAALRETSHLPAETAPPVSFVEAATGRVSTTPLPVVR